MTDHALGPAKKANPKGMSQAGKVNVAFVT